MPTEAAWLADFLEEAISFPASAHDDQVDAFCQALSYLRVSYFDSATFQEMGARQAEYHA
jgi:phage terminase large subunit-like protein